MKNPGARNWRYHDILWAVALASLFFAAPRLAGLFASKAVIAAGADGLFYGGPGPLGKQILAVQASWVLVFVGTLIILGILKAIMGLKVHEEEEQVGIDLSQHGETAYRSVVESS